MLEMQDSVGGTWLTHRYPEVRSDSDLYTFGYRFKPWTGAPPCLSRINSKVCGRGHRG